MKNRLSQISIFIIIGFIIIFMMILLISTRFDFKKNDLDMVKQINLDSNTKVKRYVEYCLERQVNNAFNWALFENGNYQSGTATEDPDIPVLFTYDLWYHNFDVQGFNRQGIAPSIKKYLDDTFHNCYNFDEMNQTFGDLEITQINPNPEFIVNVMDTSVNVVYNQSFKIVEIDNGKSSVISSFEYNIKEVPIAALEDDVNTLLGKLNQYLQSVDGRTDGESKMKWGENDINSNILNEATITRDDLNVYTIVDNSTNTIHVIYDYDKIWHETYFYFKIQSQTQSSIDSNKYYNNVVNRYYNNNTPFSDKRVIIEKDE